MPTSSRSLKLLVLLGLIGILLVACSNSNGGSGATEIIAPDLQGDDDSAETDSSQEEGTNEEEPVVITMVDRWDEERMQDRMGLVNHKMDHVSIQHIQSDVTSENLQEIMASGTTPDIITAGGVHILEELDMLLPLDDLVEQFDFDLDSLDPGLVAHIRALDPAGEGRLIGMPDGTGYATLYYNKEIFDLFGVPYPDPEKSMTWDELLDLAREMTAERNGVKYIGLQLSSGDSVRGSSLSLPLRQFAINATDPETGESLVTKDPRFKQYFELLYEYYRIPSIYEWQKEHDGDMFQSNMAAMAIDWQSFLTGEYGEMEYTQENIEIAPQPVWKDQPDTGHYLGTTPMMINKHSENIELAFEVLMEYVSKENQTRRARTAAGGPAYIDPDLEAQYGQDDPGYKGKNVLAFYQRTPAEYEQVSRWDSFVNYDETILKLAETDIDVNTALRELEEEINVAVEEAKGQQ
ncbi:extracellular solute-binding protein [Lederbergia ruris]|uniref:extracellular solute-binding protein n=1 Tax=Lederbergia ruris TaxID=217495 RepID=UPI0039A3C3C7